ncbi:MAG: TetR/AcrR family transcriptional regulator [Myxococcota bacterium]|nr:TetR/AcrR family transcriptional regulator [Myxococcota bacterium]
MSRSASLGRVAASSEHAGYAKSRETRARILEAALAEVSDSGFHRASLARIASRAGVALGSVNYHFGSRDELLRELMTALMSDLMARLDAADAGEGADFFERERAALLTYLDHVRTHPALVRLADEIKLHEPDLYRRGADRMAQRMAARIRAGIEEGTLRPMDEPRIAAQAQFLLGARHFLERMIENGDGLGDEAVVDSYLGLVRDGLGRGPRRPRRERGR